MERVRLVTGLAVCHCLGHVAKHQSLEGFNANSLGEHKAGMKVLKDWFVLEFLYSSFDRYLLLIYFNHLVSFGFRKKNRSP